MGQKQTKTQYQPQVNIKEQTKYQPWTQVKDWLNQDIPNDLKAYQQYYNCSGQQEQQNIQYNYAKGNQFNMIKDQGNNIFKRITLKCQNEKVPYYEIKQQLQQVMTYYEAAEAISQLNQEKASIYKNIGTVYFKLLLYSFESLNQVDLFKKGILSMQKAVDFAQRDNKRNKDWYAQLFLLKHQALKEILNAILNQKSDINKEDSKIILDLKQFAKDISLKIDQDSHLITQKQIFSIQEQFIQQQKKSEEYFKAQHLQENLNLDLKLLYQASQKSSNEKIRFFYQQRYEELDKTIHEYEAFKYLQLGNKIYQKEQENKILKSSYNFFKSEIIWEAIDAYKSAIKLFEGNFLHIEAESSFMLGQIYLEMFGHSNEKARDYIRNSILLQLNSSYSCINKWFSSAEHIMKMYQSEAVEKDSKMFEIWKSKNQNIIDEINLKQSQGVEEFIKFITQTHLPSRCQDFQIKTTDFLSNESIYKLLKKLFLLYHADKILEESQHFKFIAKQIMIQLTQFFEEVK